MLLYFSVGSFFIRLRNEVYLIFTVIASAYLRKSAEEDAIRNGLTACCEDGRIVSSG